MTKSKIRAAMMQALISGAVVPSDRIKWPNFAFTTPSGVPWLRFTIFYPERTSFGLADLDRQPVLVQIDVFAPKGSNDIASTGLADQIESLYPRNTKLQFVGGFIQVEGVTVRENPNDPNWYHTMVEVNATAWGDRIG